MTDIKERSVQGEVSSLLAILEREAAKISSEELNVEIIYETCIDISVNNKGDKENFRITPIPSANPPAQWELKYSAKPKRAEQRFPQPPRDEEPLSSPLYKALREKVRGCLPIFADMSLTFPEVSGSFAQVEEIARYFIYSSKTT